MRRMLTVFLSITFAPVLVGPLVAQSPVRLPAERIRALTMDTGLIRMVSGASTRSIATLNQDVLLGPGDLVVAVDTATPPTQAVADASRLQLGIRGFRLGDDGAAHDFNVIVERHAGLQYDHEALVYRGQVFVGIEDPQHPADRGGLGTPLDLQFFGPERVDPGLVSVDHIDVPLLPVLLEARSPADSLVVRVRPRGQPAVTFAVAVNRVPLEIRPASHTIDGYGLGTVELAVPFPAAFAGDSLTVTITGETASPEPGRLTLRRGTIETVTARSKGSRTERFTVIGPHFTAPAQADVTFATPIAFALAALFGGALGALGRELARRRKKKKKNGEPRQSYVKQVIGGLIAGVFIAVAYALGVNLLGLSVSGPPVEALIFLLAGLGAIGGIEALVRLVPAVGDALNVEQA